MNANPTRADDERILAWLRLRDEHKLSARIIAAQYGVTRNSVIGALFRVDKATVDKADTDKDSEVTQ